MESQISERPPLKQPKIWNAGTLTYTSGTLVALFGWLLLGDFAWSMRDRSVGPMAGWYLQQLKVSNLFFGLLVSSFPALVNSIVAPIASVKSDRHRGRRGRRIPFLLATTPFAVFGMLGLAATPYLSKWLHEHLPGASEIGVAILCFGIFWATFEIATIASQAVLGGLFNDVIPRELLGRFYGLFRAVSLLDGMIFHYWITGAIPKHFPLILSLIGLFYGGAFLWVCFKVKEGEYPPPTPLEEGRQIASGMRVYFKECFTKRYYLAIFVLMTAGGLSFAPVNTFSIPYAHSLGMDMDEYGKALALTYTISLALSFFLGWLADLFHPLRVVIVTSLGYALVTVWGGFFATTQTTFFIALVLHGVISGCYFTGAASLGQRLFPHEKFAQFASAAVMMAAPANILLAPLVGGFIDHASDAFRYTFLAGCVLSLVTVACALYVYRDFVKLGGPKNYQPPF